MSDEDTRTGEEQRARVDVTIDPEQMLAARDELRLRLKTQYHMLTILARASRKAGDLEKARKASRMAERLLLMIWTVENPMKSCAPEVKNEAPPRGLSKIRKEAKTKPEA